MLRYLPPAVLTVAAVFGLAGCSARSALHPSASAVCLAGQGFARADASATAAATRSYDEQVAAQTAWHGALRALLAARPPSQVADDARVLLGATTTATDQPWTTAQQSARSDLSGRLRQLCGIRLEGPGGP